MFESLFFGSYVGVSMAMAILLDEKWESAWFILFASLLIV
jgi:hypothetical protein